MEYSLLDRDMDRERLYDLGLLPTVSTNISSREFSITVRHRKFTVNTADELKVLSTWIGPRAETLTRVTGMPSKNWSLSPNILYSTSECKEFRLDSPAHGGKLSIMLKGPGVDRSWIRLTDDDRFSDLIEKTGSLWLAIFAYTEMYSH